MRRFNLAGPCNPEKHYYVRRHANIERLKKMIADGMYFVVYAPRQMGKTTTLSNMLVELEKESHVIGILLDFEIHQNVEITKFYSEVKKSLDEQILRKLSRREPDKLGEVKSFIGSIEMSDKYSFQDYFKGLTDRLSDYHISVVIDEFEGCPDEAMKDFLFMLRSFYISKNLGGNFQNLNFCLVGIRDLTQLTVGTISPFNIAFSLHIENFTVDEVKELYGQYAQESGQEFLPEAIAFIYEKTLGQPFLANRMAIIIIDELGLDHSTAITMERAQRAYESLVMEDNNNFKTIKRHAQDYRDELLKIIAGVEIMYNPHSEKQTEMRNFGLITRDSDKITIANPVYQSVLNKFFSPSRDEMRSIWQNADADSLEFDNFYSGNVVRMDVLIENFKKFMDRIGLNLFKVTENPQEIVGQYLLTSFINLAISNIGGSTFVEVLTGIGRMDIIAIVRNRKYIIETKLWAGESSFNAGLLQLADYMRKESVSEGYYVIFDPNLNSNPQELEKGSYRFDETVNGLKIIVFIIRIKPKASSILGL